jgi:hypothetical protein
VNYARFIKKSIAYPEVVALCRQAGLSLNADLETLDNSSRISADPSVLRQSIPAAIQPPTLGLIPAVVPANQSGATSEPSYLAALTE